MYRGVVSPPAISTPASLDCDESDMIRSEALVIFMAASASWKSRLDEEFDKLRLEV
jgi:hypothetical protein